MKITETMFLGHKGKDSIKEIDERVIDLLTKNKKLTYAQIVNLLELENGDRDILVDVLSKMVFSGRIKKENVTTITPNGIGMTSKFYLD